MFVLSLFVFGSSSFVLMLLKCRSGVIFHVKCYVDCAAVEIAIQPLSFILNALNSLFIGSAIQLLPLLSALKFVLLVLKSH